MSASRKIIALFLSALLAYALIRFGDVLAGSFIFKKIDEPHDPAFWLWGLSGLVAFMVGCRTLFVWYAKDDVFPEEAFKAAMGNLIVFSYLFGLGAPMTKYGIAPWQWYPSAGIFLLILAISPAIMELQEVFAALRPAKGNVTTLLRSA